MSTAPTWSGWRIWSRPRRRTDHPAYEWVVGRFRFLRSLIGDALGRSIDAGTVRADVDGRGITEWLIAMAEGLENQWLLDPEVDMVGSFERFVVELRRLVAVRG